MEKKQTFVEQTWIAKRHNGRRRLCEPAQSARLARMAVERTGRNKVSERAARARERGELGERRFSFF